MHKVRIVCCRGASPSVRCGCRFDNPVSLEACPDCFTVMRVWGALGVTQEGDFTNTVVRLNFRQRGAKLTFSTGLELNKFRRVRVWVAEYHFNILISRNCLCAATGNGDDRCR